MEASLEGLGKQSSVLFQPFLGAHSCDSLRSQGLISQSFQQGRHSLRDLGSQSPNVSTLYHRLLSSLLPQTCPKPNKPVLQCSVCVCVGGTTKAMCPPNQ